MSTVVLSAELWPTIRKLSKAAAERRAAIAYVSNDSFASFGEGDTLIVDASDHAIKTAQTSALVLERAFNRKAALFSIDSLHAKMWIFDQTAVIGSANCSTSSVTDLVEAALVSDRLDIVSAVSRLIDQLKHQATPIDIAFLKRIKRIPVVRSGWGPRGKSKPLLKSLAPRTWVVSVRERTLRRAAEEQADRELEEVEAELPSAATADWLSWSGNSRFSTQARANDILIQVFRPHTRRDARGVRVSPPGLIRRISGVPGTKTRLFYFSQPTGAEAKSISWHAFTRLVERAGLARHLKTTSTIEVAGDISSHLLELWN